MALVALSHTPVEHRIFLALLSINSENRAARRAFTACQLMELTGIRSQSTVRRGLDGLITKLSIEREEKAWSSSREPGTTYRVYSPEEIIMRRSNSGTAAYVKGLDGPKGNHSFERALRRLAENRTLSRREAQVALCCVEGLTNAQIGKRLQVSEQTVKFHLRHTFIKFGVKRRAELISRLLM